MRSSQIQGESSQGQMIKSRKISHKFSSSFLPFSSSLLLKSVLCSHILYPSYGFPFYFSQFLTKSFPSMSYPSSAFQ